MSTKTTIHTTTSESFIVEHCYPEPIVLSRLTVKQARQLIEALGDVLDQCGDIAYESMIKSDDFTINLGSVYITASARITSGNTIKR